MTKHPHRVNRESAAEKREEIKQDARNDAMAQAQADQAALHADILADDRADLVKPEHAQQAVGADFSNALNDQGPTLGIISVAGQAGHELFDKLTKGTGEENAKTLAELAAERREKRLATAEDVAGAQAFALAGPGYRPGELIGGGPTPRKHDWVRTTPKPDGWMCRRFDCGAHVTDPADLNHVTCTAPW